MTVGLAGLKAARPPALLDIPDGKAGYDPGIPLFPGAQEQRGPPESKSQLANDQGIIAMSSVIDFLEKMGCDAQLRHASPDDIAQALTETQIESALGAAIIARSTSELYALMRQGPLFCIQTTPGKEDEKEDEGEEDEEPAAPPKKKGLQKALPAA